MFQCIMFNKMATVYTVPYLILYLALKIFEMLKYNLINTFMTSTQHHYNVMHKSGILSEQELHEHINIISATNAWGTNVELNM